MSESDPRKIGLGLLLLAVSTGLLFGPANLGVGFPVVIVAIAALGLAAGALLLGTADGGRPV